MKRTKLLLTAAAVCLGMIPTFPAQAANGQITCDRLINENGYSVVARRGGEPVYQNGRLVSYRYLYSIRNRRDQGGDRGYRRGDRGYGRGDRNGRGQDNIICVWNARRDSARLIER